MSISYALLSTIESNRHFQFVFVLVTDAIKLPIRPPTIGYPLSHLSAAIAIPSASLGFMSKFNYHTCAPSLSSLRGISLSREQLCGRVNDDNLLSSASHFVGAIAVSRFVISNCIPTPPL